MSAAIAVTPRTAARIDSAFMDTYRGLLPIGPASGSRCRLASWSADKPAEQPNEARHDLRAQEARVVAGEAPLVLLQADVDQRCDREVDIGDRLAAGQREIVVLRHLGLA